MEWVTLAARAGSTGVAEGPVRMRRVVAQVAAAAVVIVCLVGVAGSIISRRIAERQLVHDVAQVTDELAESVFQPALTDAMLTDPAVTRTVLDPIVHSMLNTSLVRIKLWTPAGVVMYSDGPRLIGRTFPLELEARTALTSPRTEASISDLRRPDNQFERSRGKLLEFTVRCGRRAASRCCSRPISARPAPWTPGSRSSSVRRPSRPPRSRA